MDIEGSGALLDRIVRPLENFNNARTTLFYFAALVRLPPVIQHR